MSASPEDIPALLATHVVGFVDAIEAASASTLHSEIACHAAVSNCCLLVV